MLIQAEARFERTDANLKRVQKLPPGSLTSEEIDIVKSDRGEAEGNLGAARANLRTARINLGFTKVRAPISGRISRRNIDPFNLVKADDTVVTNIVSMDPMYVYFDLDERTILKLQKMIREGKIKWSSEPGLFGLTAWSLSDLLPVLLGEKALGPATAVWLGETTSWLQKKKAHGQKPSWSVNMGLPVLMGLSDEDGYPRKGWVNFADNKVPPVLFLGEF